MNVNDVLCVGAEPLALVDYVAVDVASPHILEQIAVGLARGAELARISIPGGEIAQLPEIIRGVAPGRGFDLVGTCIGIVPLERLLIGTRVEDGDVIVGLKSTGIHSNGLTLARKVLFEHGGFTPQSNHKVLTSTIGETLLEPTQIYVQPILDMLAAGLNAKALVHITGDGLLNLTRIRSAASFHIDYLPEPPPIFTLIQEVGQISDSEMLCTFNMGVGFCVVLPKHDVERAQEVAAAHGIDAYVLGRAVIEEGGKRIVVHPRGLVGSGKHFTPA
jgi:phosphoribosylformylglycinamidine cyclo-ligase